MSEQEPEMSDELIDDLYGFLWSSLRPRGFRDADIDHVIEGVEEAVLKEIARQRRQMREKFTKPGGD